MAKEFIQDNLRVFVVPVEIMDVPDLDIYEQMVYIVLRSFTNPREATAFPSYATIAKLGRMSRRHAMRCVESLVQKGLLEKEIRLDVSKNRKIRRTSNLYKMQRPQVVSDSHHANVPSDQQSPALVSDSHHPSDHQSPEQNHLTKSLRTTDDDINKKESSAPDSPFVDENKELIEQFHTYAIERGLHADYVNEIDRELTRAEFPLTHWTLGTALNKTLDCIASDNGCSNVPSYFMTVLANEWKQTQTREKQRGRA